MMNLHSIYYAESMLTVINYLRNLNPTVPFRFQYRLLTMTTFFEIAVKQVYFAPENM